MAEQLSCASSIDTIPDPPVDFKVGPLPVVAFVDEDIHRRGRQGTDTDPESAMQFSKIPIAARNGSRFTVLLHADSQDKALMDYGSDGSTGFAITVEGCQNPSSSWSVYPGGIWTLEPGCVTLIVQDNQSGAVTNIDIAIANSTIPGGTLCT